MSANIAELLKKVEDSTPPSKSKWAQFLPVVIAYRKKHSCSTWKAVDWLIVEKKVPEDSRRVCYHSILQGINRQKEKQTPPRGLFPLRANRQKKAPDRTKGK